MARSRPTERSPAGFPLTGVAFSHSNTKTGWTVGGGIEGRLSGNWTGKIEYLYMDLGTVSGTVIHTAAGIGANWSSDITDNILRVGLNYKFRPYGGREVLTIPAESHIMQRRPLGRRSHFGGSGARYSYEPASFRPCRSARGVSP